MSWHIVKFGEIIYGYLEKMRIIALFPHCIVLFLLFFSVSVSANYTRELRDIIEENSDFDVTIRGIKLSDLGFGDNADANGKYLALNSAVRFQSLFPSQNSALPQVGGGSASVVDGAGSVAASSAERINRVRAVVNKVTSNKAYLNTLEGKTIELPFGIQKGNVLICVESIVITPDRAYASMCALITNRKNGKELFFFAEGVELNNSGAFSFGEGNEGRIGLVSDYEQDFGESKIEFLKYNPAESGGHGTFLLFDCQGFKEFNVEFRATLLPGVLEKVNDELSAGASENVVVSTTFNVQSLDEICLILKDVGKFKIKSPDDGGRGGINDFVFDVGAVVVDLSSAVSATGMVFPHNYLAEEGEEWEGFYLSNVAVTLPDAFNANGDNSQKITIGARSVIIDELGFTGHIYCTQGQSMFDGEDAVSLKIPSSENSSGDMYAYEASLHSQNPLSNDLSREMGSFRFSLSEFGLYFQAGTFQGVDFKGEMVLPITKDDKKFLYAGKIIPSVGYHISAGLADEESVDCPMFGLGSIRFDENSRISATLEAESNMFYADALLFGRLSINASIGDRDDAKEGVDPKTSLSLVDVSFQGLHLTSDPRIYLDDVYGAVGVSSGVSQKLAMLPITIDEIGIKNRKQGTSSIEQVGVYCKMKLNLTGTQDAGGGFAAVGSFTVWGAFEEETQISTGETAEQTVNDFGNELLKKKYQFYALELNRIEIHNVEIGPVKMGGYIDFYRNDLYYGSGFTGGLDVEVAITQDKKIGLEVVAIFGKKTFDESSESEMFRYWAFDALATFPKIDIVPPLLAINAFGGGASYRMEVMSGTKLASKPGFSGGKVTYKSISGICLYPNSAMGLGIKAMIGIQAPNPAIYKGQVEFGMMFTKNGTLENINFNGWVEAATKPVMMQEAERLADLKSKADAAMSKIDLRGNLADAVSINNADSKSGDEAKRMLDKMASNGGSSGAILIKWNMDFNRPKKMLKAKLATYVNIANVIKGVNANNNAGEVDILFEPGNWHIYVGQPKMPMGLDLVGLVQTKSYLVMGTDIPPFEPVPGGDKRSGYQGLEKGSTKGFGFGSRLTLSAGGGSAFYYKIDLGTGFDVLIQNVEGKVCLGGKKDGQAFGINNWYMQGQAFVYFNGSAGILVEKRVPWVCCGNLFKKKCRCSKIIKVEKNVSINFDVLIQVKAPNPTLVEYDFEVLGCNIPIRFGTDCNY